MLFAAVSVILFTDRHTYFPFEGEKKLIHLAQEILWHLFMDRDLPRDDLLTVERLDRLEVI